MDYFTEAAKAGVSGFWHCREYQDLIELATGKDCLDLGSYKGMSAWGMAHTAKSVFSVDTFKANTAGLYQLDEITTLDDYINTVKDLPNVKWFVGTSEEASKSEEVPADFDLVFIDAQHDYESVKLDISLWWPRVRSGGYLVLHDYGHPDLPGVKEAADEVFGPAEPAMRIIQKPSP